MTNKEKDWRTKIANIISGEDQSNTKSQHPTIFHELLESNFPPEEKSLDRLGDKAQLIIRAGLEMVSWALTTTSFHFINNPKILNTLRNELQEAIPDPAIMLDSIHLEKLPYLTAYIQEGIRLADGVSSRNPRIFPNKPTKYRD